MPGLRRYLLSSLIGTLRTGQYFRVLPAHQGKAGPMSVFNATPLPNRPSSKTHGEGGDNGYYGWQGVESGRQRGQVVDRW